MLANQPSSCSPGTLALVATLLLFAAGCHSRAEYVRRADQDAYCLIREKTQGKPWEPPPNYSIIPAANSRLAVQGCLVHPQLPPPTTELYAYNLPLLRSDLQADEEAADSETPSGGEQPLGRPIPPNTWRNLPEKCLDRMVDFQSIRQEANYTAEQFGVDVISDRGDDAPKLTLEDVVDLAVLNSRDYQTQKETLYLFALQLSQERFDYQLNFLRTGNGFSLLYDHDRSGGITENTLAVPSGVGMSRALCTGGDFLATFANNIILTFNGPAGFSKNVSSRLLFRYTQPLVQRDIQFESLTQAERNLVYAARDFARFRKQFFVAFAQDYYDLIRAFRQIEIDSQNYFSLVRAFNQAEQEFLAGQVPRFQVDQVEQNLLSGRGRLIGTCNQVEQSLDALKLQLGIPTETPINVDLRELNELTRLDQLSVSADSANRVVTRLENALQDPDSVELLSTAAVLLDRIVNAASLQGEDAQNSETVDEFIELRQRYLIAYTRLASQQILADLRREIESDSPSASVIFQRSLAHSESLLRLVERQLDFAALEEQDEAAVRAFDERREMFATATDSLFDDLQRLVSELRVQEIDALVERAEQLRRQLEDFTAEIDQALGLEVIDDPESDRQRIVAEMQTLVTRARDELTAQNFGLKPIEIGVDDAMLTALVLRFDLMNQREALADNWRQIKLAADDLKAIIDIEATQIINTDSNTNEPFNFTFDDSRTSLGLLVDAPLNRFIERNNFRASLIDYQRELRNLMQLEDSIKFSVRNDLRNLTLDREQYIIAVASAALAYERVVSTSLEFRLGTGGVTARDFLEAQTAYIDALSAVASRHIDYIVDRAQLFLDLELLYVDNNGFWEDIRNEDVQPEPAYTLPPWAFPVYGKLPCVWYSKEVRDMMETAGQVRSTSFPQFMPEIEVPPRLELQAIEQADATPLQGDHPNAKGTVQGAEELSLPDALDAAAVDDPAGS